MTPDTPTPAVPAAAELAIAEIARRCLGIDTLDTRNADALDFHACHVGRIAQALLQAWLDGAAHAHEPDACAEAERSPLSTEHGDRPAPGLKRYHVTIEQPMLTRLTVDARDREEAEDIASNRYMEEPIDFSRCDFGSWDVIGIEEVQS